MCKQWDCQKLDKPFVVYKKLHFINVVKSDTHYCVQLNS